MSLKIEVTFLLHVSGISRELFYLWTGHFNQVLTEFIFPKILLSARCRHKCFVLFNTLGFFYFNTIATHVTTLFLKIYYNSKQRTLAMHVGFFKVPLYIFKLHSITFSKC